MTSFYEKRGNIASAPGNPAQADFSSSPKGGYGLGISGPRLDGGGFSSAPSGSGMFPINQPGGMGSKFQTPQYALTPPSGGNADVAGINAAMERFKKMGTDMVEKNANLRRILLQLFRPAKLDQAQRVMRRGGSRIQQVQSGWSTRPRDSQHEMSRLVKLLQAGIRPGRHKDIHKGVLPSFNPSPLSTSDATRMGKLFGQGSENLLTQSGTRRLLQMRKQGTESKLRNLASKHAAQDNSLDSRSATGEGKGLTYKTNDDDHATGTAAWDSLSQYMKTADDLEKEAWVGPAISAAARVGSKVLPWAARGLGWGAKGAKTMAQGVSKVPRMYRAGGGGVKGVAAGGKQLSRSVLGRAPGGAGRYARGTGVRGLIGRHPIEAMLTVGSLGMGGFGGGGSPQAQGGPGGGGYGFGGGGYQPGQQDQWNPDWTQVTQPVGHTPKTPYAPPVTPAPSATQTGNIGGSNMEGTPQKNAQDFGSMDAVGKQIKKMRKGMPEYKPHGSAWAPLIGGFLSGGIKPNPGESGFAGSIREGHAGARGSVKGGLVGGTLLAIITAILSKGRLRGAGVGAGVGAGLGSSLGNINAVSSSKRNTPVNMEDLALILKGKLNTKTSFDHMTIKTACDTMGLTPYQLTFALRVHEANLSPQQIKEGIDKAGEYMGEEYVEEIREGMDKIASMDKEGVLGTALAKIAPTLAKIGIRGAKSFPRGQKLLAKPTQKLISGPARDRITGVNWVDNAAGAPKTSSKYFNRGGPSRYKPSVSTIPAPTTQASLGGFKSQALRAAGGAFTGNQMAGEDAPWYVRAPMMLGGAAFGRAMPRLSAAGKAHGTRALWGGLGGEGIDMGAGALGHDTGGRFSQFGALGGFASPLVKGFAPGAKGSKFIASKFPAGSRAATNLKRTVVGAPLAAMGVGAGNEIIDSKVEAARQQSMQDIMSNPQIQSALEQAQRGGGFMDSLSGIANVIDPILELMGMDPSQMNPLMKIMLMAGGGLGIGGLLSGSKGAGMGGLGMMAVPLIAQYMKQQKGGGAPSAPSGLDQAVRQEQGRFSDAERTAFEQLPQAQQNQFNALPQQQQQQLLEEYRSNQTEMEKATA